MHRGIHPDQPVSYQRYEHPLHRQQDSWLAPIRGCYASGPPQAYGQLPGVRDETACESVLGWHNPWCQKVRFHQPHMPRAHRQARAPHPQVLPLEWCSQRPLQHWLQYEPSGRGRFCKRRFAPLPQSFVHATCAHWPLNAPDLPRQES